MIYDLAVVGAGFGGMATALRAAERGLQVLLLERLAYPGGCASTFTKHGARYEAGATLFSGLGEGQLFRRWIDAYAMDVRTVPTRVIFRSDTVQLEIDADRSRLVQSLCAVHKEQRAAIEGFFAWQARIADVLWGLFDDPALLPPLNARALIAHVRRTPRYVPLLPILGTSLLSQLRRFGIDALPAVRQYCDAVCQITVQASAAEAEAAFALSAMDYYFRGTAHIEGGIGMLAQGMIDALRSRGGDVRLGTRVRRLEQTDRWLIDSSKGAFEARKVVLNLTPAVAAGLIDEPEHRQLAGLSRRVESGFSAVMWYFNVPPTAPRHYELIDDAALPFTKGNHVFCSVGEAGSVTMSTHLLLSELAQADKATLVSDVQARMWQTLQRRAPELAGLATQRMPASPRTFERFTGRQSGAVGGVPRRVGLRQYASLGLVQPRRDLWLVGDSVGFGQSTLATALTGLKLADAIAHA